MFAPLVLRVCLDITSENILIRWGFAVLDRSADVSSPRE
jgi:hypothetical protein